MTVTIDNLSRLLEIIQIRCSDGTPTLLNIETGFKGLMIRQGTDTINFKENFDFCRYSKMINNEKEDIALTQLGNEFLAQNNLEVRKEFLITIFLMDNELSKILFTLLHKFEIQNEKYSFRMDLIMNNFKQYTNWFDLLYDIEFLVRDPPSNEVNINLKISSTPEFKKLISTLEINQNKPISLATQEKNRKEQEEQNKITGERAENIVVKYEKLRLKLEGYDEESNAVKQISVVYSNAGYDIESFNEKAKDLETYDRHIEVKGTTTGKFRFFWSKNEIKTAKKLDKNYWIYVVINVDEQNGEPQGDIIERIQNPFKKIFPLDYFNKNEGKFKIECESYMISKN